MPHFRNKVVPVTNINNYDGLEISEKDMDLLINKVNITYLFYLCTRTIDMIPGIISSANIYSVLMNFFLTKI